MEFLYLLSKIRVPLLDELMLLITRFGEETAFLVAAMVIFWCVDKNRGYYMLSVGFLGTMLNNFLKLLCRVPRPWIKDPAFPVVEGAKGAATGYSFPSGHSQSAVGTFGSLACTEKNKLLRWIFIAIAVLVPFSRMYLGVHTPADVLVGSGCALVLIFALRFVKDGKGVPYVLGALAVISVAFVCFVEFFPFPADLDTHNYESGIKNAYTMLGATTGLLLVYFVEKKWVHFPVKAIWWAQLAKIALGLVAVMIVKSGLKAPLNALFGTSFGTAVRYFLIVVVAGGLWPLTFRWFSKLGKKES